MDDVKTINLDSEIEEIEEEQKEEIVPKKKKVDWKVYVENVMPSWNPKFKRIALNYLLENNPESVTLTDKPTKKLKSAVMIGGESVLDFVTDLERKGYNKVFFKKFSMGSFAILEVK